MAYEGAQRSPQVLYGVAADIPSASAVGLFVGDLYWATDTAVIYELARDTGGTRAWLATLSVTTAPGAGVGAAQIGASNLILSYLGGARVARRATAGNLTCDSGGVADYYVGVTSTASARTITLPAATAGRAIIVKDESGGAGTNSITVVPASGTIDGQANYVISSNYGLKGFISDGTNWFTL